ncbi:dipeptidase [Streptomyces turgidiscabies]|uniref:Renal dipeptidase family protein n=1 Tax=Streptomyces turgidiscabies (strain Car8) TaxID=698760 RepID=L7EPE9_STRT8|nr:MULTISPECIES: dipeptidase [Streptomyces]ELP61358.1 renal dipeptidase family protein [Streptomyces turgidiscabies Car8]MDX3493519.1 dipeptidase [Streptomyces turgidiscabies]GAQ76815.1 membrane dipeptidase (peptidase family M19) [Streptomyces turgidiscabies]
MADLQDELRTTAEVGKVDPPAPAPEPDEPPGDAMEAELALALLADPDADPLDRAHALLAANPVADGYSGLPWALRHLPWYDLELGESTVDTDVPRMRRGHVGALFWALHLPEGLTGDRAVGATLEQLDLARTVARSHPEGLRLVGTAGQVTDARNCGRVAVVLGPAAAAALDDSIGILRVLHSLGLRVLTLAGTSWASEAGLTRFGEEVVREMNRLGVLADLSGASPATIDRAVTISKAPVLCTRSAARALRPHPANLPDETLAGLGAAGGLCLVPLTAEQTGPSVRDVADHLDHVRAVAGPECVGLSGTYDSGSAHPQELGDASCYPNLIAELLRRGWTEPDLTLLTWGNVQRVLRSADFTAKAAQQRREPSTARIAELDD